MKKNCIIIAGANGEMGIEFINKFISKNTVIAISKNKKMEFSHPNLISITSDLTNPEELEKAFMNFDPSDYKKVILIHSIGKDKFENTQYPKIDVLETIDSGVYISNVNTYKYISKLLIKKVEIARKKSNVKLKLVMVGSVADKYGLSVITSFSESKNIVRSYMKNATYLFPWVSALVINVSSTITKSALEIRPYSDTTYWLTPKEVVEKSKKRILSQFKKYQEIDIFKKDPRFENNYYFNDEAIFNRWTKYVHGNKK